MKNVRAGLILLPLGLLAGMAMSLYAFHPIVQPGEGLVSYDDLPRRLLRLGHIAAVMLPVINIVVGPWVDRLAPKSAPWFIWGAVGLPLALWAEALVPALRPLHPSGLPATAFTVGTLILAVQAWRADFTLESSPLSLDPAPLSQKTEDARKRPRQEGESLAQSSRAAELNL